MKPEVVTNAEKLKAVDFFCGAGGVTCGFLQANIEVLGGIDNDRLKVIEMFLLPQYMKDGIEIISVQRQYLKFEIR